jgi:hypothetical protein
MHGLFACEKDRFEYQYGWLEENIYITCSQMAKVPIVAGGRSIKFTFETARWFCFATQSFRTMHQRPAIGKLCTKVHPMQIPQEKQLH